MWNRGRSVGIALLAVGVLATAAGCSDSEPDLPRGDALDVLLNQGALQAIYVRTSTACLQRQGIDPAPYLDLLTGASGAVSVAEPAAGSSGIAAGAIGDPAGSDGTTSELEQSLRAHLDEPVEIDGETYGSCGAYMDAEIVASPAETARARLNDAYGESASAIVSDPEWTAADAAWAECMEDRGYAGLHMPGDQLALIEQQVNQAADDDDLRAALDFDREVTTATTACLETTNVAGVQAEVRARYDEEFLDAHSAQVEELMLLVAEEQG